MARATNSTYNYDGNYRQNDNQYHDYSNNSSQINDINENYNNLRLSDQIYIIFLELKENTLSLKHLLDQLYQRFKVNVDFRVIDQLSFVQLLNDNTVQIHLHLDDICTNGNACQLPMIDCNRIHYLSNYQICKYQMNAETFKCSQGCNRLFHINHSRIRDKILGLILFLYNNRYKGASYQRKTLKQYYITRNQFLSQFYTFYQHDPLPNMHLMDNDPWRKIMDCYNKYYYDYKQQRGNKSYEILWNTQSYGHDSWCINVNYNDSFFTTRTCFQHMMHNKCNFGYKGITFCPYLHLNHKTATVQGFCHDCKTQNNKCKRYHIILRHLKRSIMLIGNSFLRNLEEINYELSEIILEDSYNLMELSNFEIAQHNKWCDALNKMRNTHISRNKYLDIDLYAQPDETIDNKFHPFVHFDGNKINKHADVIVAIDINWDLCKMNNNMNGMQSISNIYNLFHNLSETPIDIAMNCITKYVILRYSVYNYRSFAWKFKYIFQRIPRKWCYNRRVSISIKTLIDTYNFNNDSVELIIEVQNINIFCSVNMIRQWFELLLFEYNYKLEQHLKHDQQNIIDFIKFQTGSFHFIEHKSQNNEGIATVYFRDCQLNEHTFNSLHNLNVTGAQITSKCFSYYFKFNTYHSKFIHDLNPKFINYKSPIIWDILSKANKINLHCNQTEIIQNALSKINNRSNRRDSPPPNNVSNRRNSPPPLPIKNQLMYNGYNDDNKYEENENVYNRYEVVTVHNTYEIDYSDSSDNEQKANQQQINVYNDDTKDISNALQDRHLEFGNLNGKNEQFGDMFDKMCIYCLCSEWYEGHIFECWFIPKFVIEEYKHKNPNAYDEYIAMCKQKKNKKSQKGSDCDTDSDSDENNESDSEEDDIY